MILENYNSPTVIDKFLSDNEIAACKRFGQNFLINAAARRRLIDALGVTSGKALFEIGPGLGSMTREALDRGLKLTAFEIDKGFVRVLNSLFSKEIKSGSLVIVPGDALKTLPPAIKAAQEPPFLLGNLPYNIASLIIGNLFEEGLFFSRAVFTVQKEVAARLTARPGTKDYSSITALVGSFSSVAPLCTLPHSDFFPPPRVQSTAVVLTPKESPPSLDRKRYSRLIRASFSSRRKTLFNNLIKAYGSLSQDKIKSAISLIFTNPAIRAEALSPKDFLRLYSLLSPVVV